MKKISNNIVDVVIPPRVMRSKWKYPYHELKVGGSFVGNKNAYSCAIDHARRWGKKFYGRVQEDGLIKITRVF